MSVSTMRYGAATRRTRPSPPEPKTVMRPRDPAPECRDCGAFLQSVVINAQPTLRCPWARNTQPIGNQIHCDWPLGTKRVVGGIRTDSVS